MLKNGENKGITLISLIVTIIVLLILAGITINAITGSESAMEKATEAREKNEQGAELDAIKLAVVNSVASGLNGLVDANVLKNELNGLVYETSRNAITTTKTSWIVTANSGLKYKIKQNGEVTLAEPVETVEFTETTISIKIGQSKALPLSIKGKSGNETEANNIEYQFSAENIAEVLDNGQIKIKDTVNPNTKVTVTVIADGIQSSNSCEITAIENLLQIGTATNADKYGYKVEGYTSQYEKINNKTMTWRLFYQELEEDGNSYIISDELIGDYKPIEHYDSNATGSSVSAEGKGLNAKYYAYNNHWGFSSANSRNTNIKMVAWLTDTSNTSTWNTYKDTEGKASFAIASPTIDLYIESYNAVAALNDSDSINEISKPVTYKNGYSYSSRITGIDASSITHKIYCKGANTSWWLASPYYYFSYDSAGYEGGALLVNDLFGIDNDGTGKNYTHAVRPLVCIPNSKFNYTLTNDTME